MYGIFLNIDMTKGFKKAWDKAVMARIAWPRDYKTFFMLNSAEHEVFPAHKC